MQTNSDDMYDKFKDYDFADAKPVEKIPALAKLQAESGGKSRITMRVDNSILAAFKARATLTGGSYQNMMNEALRQFLQGKALEDVVRQTIQQELHPSS
ncbi:MAG: BrnA antitoxin family protein [Candidatus Thiothrix putei]|uniref:BrnA antitoxin family protein n=1 Tax=Candidatus Thiothrix putei TaxID=3080811 RepID=A0AA95HEZ9_9GAMM|nr:MAG: BrnA antitoxin family protein [Candidatus Thiothrix putei]